MSNLDLPPQNHKIKPFDITIQVNSVDEAKMLLLMFEQSPALFAPIIKRIRKKTRKHGFII